MKFNSILSVAVSCLVASNEVAVMALPLNLAVKGISVAREANLAKRTQVDGSIHAHDAIPDEECSGCGFYLDVEENAFPKPVPVEKRHDEDEECSGCGFYLDGEEKREAAPEPVVEKRGDEDEECSGCGFYLDGEEKREAAPEPVVEKRGEEEEECSGCGFYLDGEEKH